MQKWVKTTLREKWSFHTKNGRPHFLNLWWILSIKDQTLKFFFDFGIALKEFEMKICKKVILEEVHFWQFWPSRGILGITKNPYVFWRRLFMGKLYLTSIALKRAQDHPKLTLFDPPNILNKLLSRNPTLTRKCEVSKFNLVTYFTLYKYQPCGSLITQFSRPRAATIFSSFCF